jgi:hypothetical protein
MNGHLTGWRLSAGDEHLVFDGNNNRLAGINCGGMSGRTFREGADCARLIAAAPDLLAALERALDALEKLDAGDTKVAAQARAAIASATGGDA